MAYSRIKDLRQKRADITNELEAMLQQVQDEDRDFTEAEEKAYTDKKSALVRAGTMLAREEEQEQSMMQLASTRGGVLNVPNDTRVTVGETREALKPFATFGEQLTAIFNAGSPGRSVDMRLLRLNAAATGNNESVPSEGGYLVQQDFSTELVRRMYDTGQLTSRVRKIPIGANSNGLRMNGVEDSSRANGSRWGGVRVYWMAEADTKIASKIKLRPMQWDLKKVAGLWYVTDELLQDSTAMESLAMEAFSEEFNFVVEESILYGTGVGQPLGIMNSPALVAVAKEGGQGGATIQYENLVKMWSRMWGRSRPNSVWLVNQDIEPSLFTMGMTLGTGGAPVYLPPGGASQSPYATLFGRPVIEIEYANTAGAVGDIMLVDLSQYVMIEKGPMQTATSIHVRFINDETVFRFVYRCDGQPLWTGPVTPYKGTATLSPYVTLAARA